MIPIRDMLPSRRFPAVTITLIAINLLVFLYQGYLGTRPPTLADWGWVEAAWEEEGLDPPPSFAPRRIDLPPPLFGTMTTSFPIAQDELFISRYALIPGELLGGEDLPPTIPIPIWLTLLTSLFLHGGLMHILGNMLYLWIFGDNVEDAMGPGRFLIFYLVCGLAAGAAQIAIAPEPKNAHIAGSATCAAVSLDVLSRNPSSTNTVNPTPAMMATRRTSRTVRSFHAITAEPATSPRKSAAINTA